MSVNNYRPHILVVPEDDANRQILNGFLTELQQCTNIKPLPEAGGWKSVVEKVLKEEARSLRKYDQRFIVLLIDCDGCENRIAEVKDDLAAQLGSELAARIFIFGARDEPEPLRNQLNMNFEEIGVALAVDCRQNTQQTWSHIGLAHNLPELARFRQQLLPILFP